MTVGFNPASITTTSGNNLGFGCKKCGAIKRLLYKEGITPKQAKKYIRANVKKGSKIITIEKGGKLYFGYHEEKASKILSMISKFNNIKAVVEIIKEYY